MSQPPNVRPDGPNAKHARPDWLRPEGVAPGTWSYVQQRAIADHYQDFVAGTPLCDLDQRFLENHFPAPDKSSNLTEPPLVIDFGCGDGRSLLPLSQRGYRTLGIDLSESMLRCAWQRARSAHEAISRHAPMTSGPVGSAGLDLPTKGLSADELRAKDDSILQPVPNPRANCWPIEGAWVRANLVQLSCLDTDVADHAICLFSTLGMIQGRSCRRQFLQHARRIVRPSGKFVLHVHHVWSALHEPGGKRRLWTSWWKSLGRRQPHEFGDHVYAYRGLANMFLHRFRRRELNADLRASGWTIRSLHPINLSGTEFVPRDRWRPDRVGGFLVVLN